MRSRTAPTHFPLSHDSWRALQLAGLIVLLSLGACDVHPLDQSVSKRASTSGRLELSAIVRAGQATAVNVRIFFRRSGTEVDLTRTVIPLPATDSTPITVDLALCLADPLHATRGTCPILAELILVRGGVELDRATLGPIDIRPGENALFPAATLYEVATVQIAPPAAGAAAIEPESTLVLTAVAKDRTGATVTGGAGSRRLPQFAQIGPQSGPIARSPETLAA